MSTSGCCNSAGTRKTPGPARSVREFLAWALPGAVLVLVPKCPACLAAHLTIWTGLGLSFAAASYLRSVLLFLCFTLLGYLAVERLHLARPVFRYFRRVNEPCNKKS